MKRGIGGGGEGKLPSVRQAILEPGIHVGFPKVKGWGQILTLFTSSHPTSNPSQYEEASCLTANSNLTGNSFSKKWRGGQPTTLLVL